MTDKKNKAGNEESISLPRDEYDELKARADERDTFCDKYMRAHAEFENVKKRMEKDKAEMVAGIDGKSITVAAFPEADREQLLAAGAEEVKAWVALANEEGRDGDALLADYLSRIDTYTAELESKGYPWSR